MPTPGTPVDRAVLVPAHVRDTGEDAGGLGHEPTRKVAVEEDEAPLPHEEHAFKRRELWKCRVCVYVYVYMRACVCVCARACGGRVPCAAMCACVCVCVCACAHMGRRAKKR